MVNIKTIPAFVDMHVHFRDPGYPDKETIETGLASALKGGFGAVCTMPNTFPCADSPDIIKYQLKKASKIKDISLYPVAGITENLTTDIINDFKALKNAGAVAFSNDGYPVLDKNVFKNALMTGELILSHCEDETNEVKWQIEVYKDVLNSAKQGLCPLPKLHFCHISKKESLEHIKTAKLQGFNVTCETAPHYFTFTKNDVTSNGVYKMNPPLGSNEDREAVIESLKDGTIDVIATDHAPHTKDSKLAPYLDAPNGIVGLETAFGLCLNVFEPDLIIEKMSEAPKRILGIKNDKMIKVDLDETWVVKSFDFKSKCKISPYENMKLKGKVLCK